MKTKPLTATQYLKLNHAKLEFVKCLINARWKSIGMATLTVQKKMPSGNYIIGSYLVDTNCLGLKNTLLAFNLTSLEADEFIEKMNAHEEQIPCDVVFTHNLIFGAIDYANELGFKPHRDFEVTELLLDPDLIDDGIDELEFGLDGKPYFFAGPNDQQGKILAQLEKACGTGNYHYTVF